MSVRPEHTREDADVVRDALDALYTRTSRRWSPSEGRSIIWANGKDALHRLVAHNRRRTTMNAAHSDPVAFLRDALGEPEDYGDDERGDIELQHDALDAVAALVQRHVPPSVRELQDVIANHVRNLEPVATSRGVALAVHAFLVEREEAMTDTRPPRPGEYVDPQPVAVDVAGDEHVRRDDEIVRKALAAAPIDVQEAFERVFSRASGQLTDAELEPLGGGDGSGDE